MNLEFILEKMGNGKPFKLVDTAPEAVSIIQAEDFYIKPELKDLSTAKESKIFLFSAPGATGKSALAHYVSYRKKALLWDLSKERIANHSLSGMLVKSLGTKIFSDFTEGLVSGDAILVIDALDEAEMISGRLALEALLTDLRSLVENASCATIALCARTETAHFIKEFYSKPENKLPISQFEIRFFEETNAKRFVLKKISDHIEITKTVEDVIDTEFSVIQSLLGNDPDLCHSFIGYAPVLEALAVFYEKNDEKNTLLLLQRTQHAENSTEIFAKIMEHILDRERKKVVDGFRTRCEKDYSDFKDWDTVYTIDEQIIRLADYLVYGSIDSKSYHTQLPRELEAEYNDCYKPFFNDHPFIQNRDTGKGISVDFTGPAFRDYVLARLMVMGDYSEYANEYFSMHKGSARFPSQLFFDFYEFFSAGSIEKPHFRSLYDAFKSKETADSICSICLEQVNQTIYCSFIWQKPVKNQIIHKAEFSMVDDDSALSLSQLHNAYIDVDNDILLGETGEDVSICNSTIQCRKLLLQAQCILLAANQPGETLIICSDGIDNSRNPSAKFDIRADDPSILKISTPDINDWFKLRPYSYSMDDEIGDDKTRFENAAKTILKYFRKHGKDAPGKHREFIQNIIIGGSGLKQHIFDFFYENGAIFEDDKDLKQFKLNVDRLEALGVNWGQLAQSALSDMSDAYNAYQHWNSNM